MPVILTTAEELYLWLEGETVEALKMQRPLPDGMLDIVARGEKEDAGLAENAVRTMEWHRRRGRDRHFDAQYANRAALCPRPSQGGPWRNGASDF
jgi:hypothetical protein